MCTYLYLAVVKVRTVSSTWFIKKLLPPILDGSWAAVKQNTRKVFPCINKLLKSVLALGHTGPLIFVQITCSKKSRLVHSFSPKSNSNSHSQLKHYSPVDCVWKVFRVCKQNTTQGGGWWKYISRVCRVWNRHVFHSNREKWSIQGGLLRCPARYIGRKIVNR